MPPGDAQRQWFVEMIEILQQQWDPKLSWEELAVLTARRGRIKGTITREEVRNIMAWMASKFVISGKQYLNSKYIDTVYTAVFYENEPINEIGIYGYRFISPIQPNDFKAIPEFNGRLFVLHGELLIFLWHEELSRTARCFSAIEKILELHAKDPK